MLVVSYFAMFAIGFVGMRLCRSSAPPWALLLDVGHCRLVFWQCQVVLQELRAAVKLLVPSPPLPGTASQGPAIAGLDWSRSS